MNTINETLPILLELENKVKETASLSNEQKTDLLHSFNKALYELNEARFHYLQLLGLMADTDNDFNNLYLRVSKDNFADCVDKLNLIGNKRKKNASMRKAFQSMGYRLMEQTRAGKRDEVFHGVLRLYMTCNLPFDKELLFAFKQSDNEMFKVLMFSYLSGIIE